MQNRIGEIYSKLKQLIHPHSNGKFYWDMLIIVLSLFNAFYVPVELTFAIETTEMEVINYIMDCIFVLDIVVNFRTIYFDERTNDPITETRKIAINYVLRGRFFIDIVATLPLEFISEIKDVHISKSSLKLIGLIKLTRLLRLGRIITYIRMSKSFKHGIKIFLLAIYLFLIIHWIDCAAYYVFMVEEDWLPPKDVIPDHTFIYDDYTNGYFVMFYYGSLYLMSNDALPFTTLEIVFSIIFVFIGSVSLGILVGQLSTILSQITKKARSEAEKVDFIQSMMFNLKVPEILQQRIIEYHSTCISSQYIIGPARLKLLAPSLIQKISDHQLQKLISENPWFSSSDNHLASMFSKFTSIQLYLPGDVILKQGDEGKSFHFIINGYANVVRENIDMRLSQFQEIANQNLNYQKQQTIFERFKQFFMNSQSSTLKEDLEKIQKLATIKVSKKRNIGTRRSNVFIPQDNEDDAYSFLREIGQNNYFGEISLLTNLKITASVYAIDQMTCGEIEQRKFLQIISHSSDFKKKLMNRIKQYQDPLFKEFEYILRNAFIFKHLSNDTLNKISHLFHQESRMSGQTLIRKRERHDLIYFIRKGEVEVRFPYSMYDAALSTNMYHQFINTIDTNKDAQIQDENIYFGRINEGGYFNLSSALLKKFSLFEFIVSSKKVDLLILNAADLVFLSKKCEDLYYALETHAVLYEVDGQKYDFNRQIRKPPTHNSRIDSEYIHQKNKNLLIKQIKAIKPKEFLNLRIFGLLDELFNLRRDKYIKQKRRKYLKELKEKRLQNHSWLKQFITMRDQANQFNQEFTEETEEQLMKVLDTIKDKDKLLESFKGQVCKMQNDLERRSDRFIQVKCFQAGIEVQEFEDMIQQADQVKDQTKLNISTAGPEFGDILDEDYIAKSEELIHKQPLSEHNKSDTSVTDSDDVETEFDDIRFIIEKHKQEEMMMKQSHKKSLSREKLFKLENVDLELLKNQKSFVQLESINIDFRDKIKKAKESRLQYMYNRSKKSVQS
ncbi:voltage-gated ion channel superfamily [Stylonychia lemnae]|uniref:Voltage-gated ion channel superfamily n=1 Tax=Stylonychia lemnae TaxID=5949 RepID=A0A078AZG5_STYLE|nr:voltage-gated ion channel superfamily [Stylonychia lemnae]|eukprot:CDW87544.1 voltage-gated ion channel superfamily [Stylonychia lemnae]